MEKINSITEWFEFSSKFQKIEEKLEDAIKNTGHTISVSYTHLDVYKRQECIILIMK